MSSNIEGEASSDVPQIIPFEAIEGGGGREGSTNVPTAGFLPKMLFFEGFSAIALGMGAMAKPTKGFWSRSLHPEVYYLAVPVMILFGVWLLKLSFLVAGKPNRRTLAKAVMLATLAPLLVVLALHVFGADQNMSPSSLLP